MSVRSLLSAWSADPSIAGCIDAWHNLPARPAQFEPLPPELHPALVEALGRRGIEALYSHQAATWRHVQDGRHVAVVTGTASGKTLCYNLPVVDRALWDAETRALYLFPTKALAQDQRTALEALVQDVSATAREPQPGIPVAVYDGDTSSSARTAIRQRARLVISNPDMLHTGILPHHTAWAEFFRRLQFVVIDEMHTYRGVFGSHVANVLRRLRRIARFYGAQPQFILTSATIGNPGDLAARLIEEPIAVVSDDGAARGPKAFLIYNPPVVNRELGLRRSALQESVRLADDLLAYGVQTILFGRSRRSVEIILTYLQEKQGRETDTGAPTPPTPSGPEAVRGYRSGYLPRKRREIEQGLRAGQVRAVVATNALELGIDIGALGAAVLVGYPGSIAAAWQQAGRAGRGQETSLAVLVATADPLDQFLAAHPDYFFDRSPEQALINPDNLLILLGHLRCAAFELPFTGSEGFGRVPAGQVAEFLEFLEAQGELHRSGAKYFWMAEGYPAQGVSLRSASAARVLLQVGDAEQDQVATIGEVDEASAHWMVHPEAIYLHEGQTYRVEELDLEGHTARLRPVATDYYTEPRSETQVQLIEQVAAASVPGGHKAHGELRVISQVVGFRQIKWYTHEQLGMGELSLPPVELVTTGYWLALDESTVERLREQGLWRNDPNDYGPNWTTQRENARRRDGFRCQVCGILEDGRQHDVHHKTPFRTFPSWEQANRLENLITLCPPCHHRAETAVRVRSGLAGLSFVLRHLAPLFLMCDTRDLGVHADPQSPLAEGRPAVVLYDLIPAGIGFSGRLFEMHAELLQRAYELVTTCDCTDGCPSCTGPGGELGLGSKQETLAILSALIQPLPGRDP